MFKMPITYTGFDGKEKTKDFYFNLNKGEIAEINYSVPGGLDGFISKLNDDPDVSDVIEVFKMIIIKSYGRRTTDNKFIKSKTISEEFAASDAYSELFLKFLENEDNFVNTFLEGAINVPAETMHEVLSDASAEAVVESAIPSDI